MSGQKASLRGEGYQKKGGASATVAANSEARKRIEERAAQLLASSPARPGAPVEVAEPVRGSARVGLSSDALVRLGALAGAASLLADLVLVVTR